MQEVYHFPWENTTLFNLILSLLAFPQSKDTQYFRVSYTEHAIYTNFANLKSRESQP